MNEHNIGNEKCPGCDNGYPMKCKCGGLIHCSWTDEFPDGLQAYSYKCDKCDSGNCW